jgi:hypothetical protein
MGRIVFAVVVVAGIVAFWGVRSAGAVTPSSDTYCYGGGGPCLTIGNSPGGIGIQGVSSGGNSGAGVSAVRNGFGGYALQANNSSGVGVYAAGSPAVQASGSSIGVYSVGNPAVRAQISAANALLFQGIGIKGATVFRVDSRGNGYFGGKVVTGTLQSSQPTSTGQTVATYASEVTSPVIEDFGEISLVGGAAYVRIDARFVSATQGAKYMVFATPQSPVSGNLYVTQKTPSGFVLRETAPARSTAIVDYRIVAQPFGSIAARLRNVASQ